VAGIKVIKAEKGLVALWLHSFLCALIAGQNIARNRIGVNRQFAVYERVLETLFDGLGPGPLA
jgi:hypothetical protein